MSVEATTVYRWACDRCACVVTAEDTDDDEAAELPAGWSRVSVRVSGSRRLEKELCPQCSVGVIEAMNPPPAVAHIPHSTAELPEVKP